MQWRATSRKCTKDTEITIDMEDKEAQPAPEAEVIVGDTQENQPERPAQTENINYQEIIK